MISYAVGAVSFFGLLLLLLTRWRSDPKCRLLMMAVVITMVWAAVSACYAGTEFRKLGLSYQFLEIARNIAWIGFLFQLFKPVNLGKDAISRIFRCWYTGLLVFAGLPFIADLFPYPFGSVDVGIFGHMSLAVSGLVLIEQLFRNTRPEQRQASKFLYLGIGTLFAYDVFLYSNALLFQQIDNQVWYARGLVNAMVVPLIALSVTRNPQWPLDIFVSRRMVIHSVSIVGAGVYLLAMAGLGYYIRVYGGTWGNIIQMVFLWGAGLLLLVMIVSRQLRAYFKVFLSKHFLNYKYDYREEWLKFIGTLSAGESVRPLRERAIHAMAEILDSPGGMLWTRRENNSFFLAATWNLGKQIVGSESGNSSLINFLERRQWVIELDEYATEPELYAGLSLPCWLQKMRRAWIIVPLMHVDRLQGFIVLARPPAGRQINWEDHDLLKTAGRQVASYIALLDTTDALMDARQFEAFNRLSAYLVHDLKNITAQLSLVVSNAARHKNNPAFVDDTIRTVENTTAKMNRMLAQLRKGASHATEARLFNLDNALQEVITAQAVRRPVPVFVESACGLTLWASRDRFTAVLGHLIQNAQEATPAAGRVEVKTYQDGRMAVIEVTDNGCGMDEHFIRERLFRPFNTTKGNAGMGIGVYESREFVHALGGEIHVISKPAVGTTFFIRLPLAEESVVPMDIYQEMEVSIARAEQKIVNH